MGAADQVRDVLLVMSHPSHTTGVNDKCGSRARICTHDAVGIGEPQQPQPLFLDESTSG